MQDQAHVCQDAGGYNGATRVLHVKQQRHHIGQEYIHDNQQQQHHLSMASMHNPHPYFSATSMGQYGLSGGKGHHMPLVMPQPNMYPGVHLAPAKYIGADYNRTYGTSYS